MINGMYLEFAFKITLAGTAPRSLQTLRLYIIKFIISFIQFNFSSYLYKKKNSPKYTSLLVKQLFAIVAGCSIKLDFKLIIPHLYAVMVKLLRDDQIIRTSENVFT